MNAGTTNVSRETDYHSVGLLTDAAAVESLRIMFNSDGRIPQPEWVRGRCPDCGDHLVSNCYYVGGKGYVICWECWSSLSGRPTCGYRKVI